LAIQQPQLLDAVRNILTDTEFSHAGKPGELETVRQQIKSRITLAEQFASAHGTPQG
jgi:hypothetical protein